MQCNVLHYRYTLTNCHPKSPAAILNRCNLQLKVVSKKAAKDDEDYTFELPVVFHNLKSYDSHVLAKNFKNRIHTKTVERRGIDL